MRLAAIDIGSNAARLLISDVKLDSFGNPVFNKLNLIRVPLRLGFDVFEKGIISKEKRLMVLQTMKAFAHLMKAYDVQHLKACATSAMRDAGNSNDIIKKIKLETDIEIKVITGDEEANYIYENHIAENLDKLHAYLYIDVGGGSTEITFIDSNNYLFKKSVPVISAEVKSTTINGLIFLITFHNSLPDLDKFKSVKLSSILQTKTSREQKTIISLLFSNILFSIFLNNL